MTEKGRKKRVYISGQITGLDERESTRLSSNWRKIFSVSLDMIL